LDALADNVGYQCLSLCQHAQPEAWKVVIPDEMLGRFDLGGVDQDRKYRSE